MLRVLSWYFWLISKVTQARSEVVGGGRKKTPGIMAQLPSSGPVHRYDNFIAQNWFRIEARSDIEMDPTRKCSYEKRDNKRRGNGIEPDSGVGESPGFKS